MLESVGFYIFWFGVPMVVGILKTRQPVYLVKAFSLRALPCIAEGDWCPDVLLLLVLLQFILRVISAASFRNVN